MRKLRFLFVLLAMVSLASFGFEGENILSNEINAEISTNVQVTELTDSIPVDTPLLFENKGFCGKFVFMIILAIVFGIFIVSSDYVMVDKFTKDALAPRSKDKSKTQKTTLFIIGCIIGVMAYYIVRLFISPDRFLLNHSVKDLHFLILYLIFLLILLLSVAIYVEIYRKSYLNKIGEAYRILRTLSLFFFGNAISLFLIIDDSEKETIFFVIFFIFGSILSLVSQSKWMIDKREIIKPDEK